MAIFQDMPFILFVCLLLEDGDEIEKVSETPQFCVSVYQAIIMNNSFKLKTTQANSV